MYRIDSHYTRAYYITFLCLCVLRSNNQFYTVSLAAHFVDLKQIERTQHNKMNLAENKFKRVHAERDTKRIGKNAFYAVCCAHFLIFFLSGPIFRNSLFLLLPFYLLSPQINHHNLSFLWIVKGTIFGRLNIMWQIMNQNVE